MKKRKNLSFKEAAIQILKVSKEPLSARQITEIAIEQGLIETSGKTPEASMGAQIYVDISKYKNSKFRKVGTGKFTLRNQSKGSNSPLELIDDQNTQVKGELMARLHALDPFQFEYLAADLLQKIGYENVEVTQRTGDKGIDIIANLTMDGITNVKTVIQVKRYKKGNNVSGKVIRQLRGSAEVDQRGLVITTSDFTKDAISESCSPKKTPVSLVNGSKLLDLLLKHEIGVRVRSVDLLTLDNEYFENEDDPLSGSDLKGKNRSIWPLPGGTNNYCETLTRYLETIRNGTNTKKALVDWYISSFENVTSEKTANGYINVPRNMGLTIFRGKYVELTDPAREFLQANDIEVLYETISNNILAFGDIVEFVRTSSESVSAQQVYDFICENFDVQWATFAQVNFRLTWLVNLKKLVKGPNGYLLP